MKLDKIIFNVSLCAVGALFAACGDVDEDERFVYVEPAEVSRRVLIEDFTGQRCINCPNGAAAIEQIQKDYGADNIIAVGLYSGPLGRQPNGTPLPLYTEDANYYYEQFGVSVQPTARIDRGGLLTNVNDWAGAVYARIQTQATVMLDASCAYDAGTRTVEITVKAEGIDNANGRLQVWLTEDSIVSPQMLPGNVYDKEYVHNHAFRATVNGREGDAISLGVGETVSRTFTYTIKDDWVPGHMAAVAFIYDNSGVLQAAKAPFIPSAGGGQGEDE